MRLLLRTDNANRFYTVGNIFVALSVLLSFVSPPVLLNTTILIASICFAVGVLLEYKSNLMKVWKNHVTRVLLYIVHLLIGVLVVARAREMVSLSLGLPAQDFDLTVSFVALLFYIPVWGLCVTVMLGMVLLLLPIFWILVSSYRDNITYKNIVRFIGVMAVMFFSSRVADVLDNKKPLLFGVIRYVAYYADYQPTYRYPDVQMGERIILHENGVISSASIDGSDVDIKIRRFQ